jgi:hypothetical protein
MRQKDFLYNSTSARAGLSPSVLIRYVHCVEAITIELISILLHEKQSRGHKPDNERESKGYMTSCLYKLPEARVRRRKVVLCKGCRNPLHHAPCTLSCKACTEGSTPTVQSRARLVFTIVSNSRNFSCGLPYLVRRSVRTCDGDLHKIHQMQYVSCCQQHEATPSCVRSNRASSQHVLLPYARRGHSRNERISALGKCEMDQTSGHYLTLSQSTYIHVRSVERPSAY